MSLSSTHSVPPPRCAGDLKIEEFSLDAARACDVVFLAVSGDFAEEWAEKIADGDAGAPVIDNSPPHPPIPRTPSTPLIHPPVRPRLGA